MLLLSTPFRVFFLLAGAMAAAWIPLWIMILMYGTRVDSNLGFFGWHGHEMVFGYTGAVLAGFLLTAVRNWTKRATIDGVPLALLVIVWVAGRVINLRTASLPPWLPTAIDGVFWLALAVAVARPIIASRSRRNYAFPVLLVAIGGADAVMHLCAVGELSLVWRSRALFAALDAIALVILIFGGRIIPMFTGKAVTFTPRSKGALDWAGLALVGALMVAHAATDPSAPFYWLAIAAGAVNVARLWGWGGRSTVRKPILWVLHVGWLLLAGSLILQGVAGLSSSVPASAATHLLTVGGIGVTTLGMMARVSLGHTGRALVVPTTVAIAFAILVLAALARVATPIFAPDIYRDALRVTGVAWAVAFALFTIRYAPILLSPRADGKPG